MLTDAAIVANVNYVEKPNALVENEEQYNFADSLKKYLGKMSEIQIKNQVQQILNYSDNLTGITEYDLASLVSNFASILSENTDSQVFKESLNRSLECLVDFDILGRLDDLKVGDRNSFLQVPVEAVGHLFGCVIYRIDDNSFEFVLVNKGLRNKLHDDGYHDTCEAYMVSRSNLKYVVENCLINFSKKGKLETAEVYDVFEKRGVRIVDTGFNKEDEYLLYSDIELVNQKKGNCFYKNEEAALLFAWNNAMDENNFNKLKSPISTADLHVKYVNNIRDIVNSEWYNYTKKDELLKFLDESCDIYLKNKKFREYYKENYFDSAREKRLNVISIFLDEDKEYLKNLPSNFLEKKLDDSLALMDLQTLTTHMDIINLSKNREIFCNVILFSYGVDNMWENINTLPRMYFEFRNKYYNIAKVSIGQLDLQYAGELGTFVFFTGDKELINILLELNKDDYSLNLVMGLLNNNQEYLEKAARILPNASYALIMSANSDSNLKQNISNYIKRIDEQLERNSNNLDVKYDMVDLKCDLLSSEDIEKEDIEKEDIEKMYLDLVNEKDKDALTYFNLGVYAHFLDRIDEAKENFLRAEKMDNKYKYMCARFLWYENRNKEAISLVQEILDEDPNDTEALLDKLDMISDMTFAYDSEEDDKEYYKDLIIGAIEDSKKLSKIIYNTDKEYMYIVEFNKFAYRNGIDIPNAKENALADARKLYDTTSWYKQEAIWNIYELGEIEEAFTKCTNDDNYILWKMLWDLSDKIEEDENLANEVERVLKKVINIDNVKYYNELKGKFKAISDEGKESAIERVLGNALKEFFNR